MFVRKIISGAQSGAEQAAHDFAIAHDIPHGGWAPRREPTDKRLFAERYKLQEMPGSTYPWDNRRMNVVDSDGTLIISHGELTGSLGWSKELAERHSRPCMHMDLNKLTALEGAPAIMSWLLKYHIEALNITGPRNGEDSEIYYFTMDVLNNLLCLDIVRNNGSYRVRGLHTISKSYNQLRNGATLELCPRTHVGILLS